MKKENEIPVEITKTMGETLVMFQLSKYGGVEVNYVDSTGADLIAIDLEDQTRRYAISVKTRNHKSDGHSCSSFRFEDEVYLKKFAANMSYDKVKMVPIVAYVVIRLDGAVCTFFINLDDLVEMSKESKIIKVGKNNNYLFVYGNQGNPSNCKSTKGKEKSISRDKAIFDTVLKENRIKHIVLPLTDNSVMIKDKSEFKKLYKDWDYSKDELLSKEYMENKHQGDFGEKYIVWRAKDYGLRAYHVNTVGVDVLLQDKEFKEKIYAISVKTFTKAKKNSYTFEIKNVDNLTQYAELWGFTPVVAMNFIIEKENKKILYNINMELSYFKKIAIKQNKRNTEVVRGYRIKWNNEEELEKFKEDSSIIFTKMTIE